MSSNVCGPSSRARTLAMLVFACLTAACDLVRPLEETCRRKLGPAVFSVSVEPAHHTIDHSNSAARLSAEGAARSGRLILGIASAQMKSSASLNGSAITSPLSGKHCMRPGVDVRLSVNPLLVRIASEQAEGSCEYTLTLRHEMRHVQVYERYLEDLAPRVEAALRSGIEDRIYLAPNRAAGEHDMAARVDAVLRPLIEQSMRDVEKRQAAVDSADEYARLDSDQARCLH
jgi:ribosomal protein S7